jgi:hypothetical protein
MSKKLVVFSTLASDVAYTNHAKGGADLPVPLPPVTIKGGAGVANDRIVTPRGVATYVTEEQVAYLRENEIFKLHEKNGFVMVSDTDADPDQAAADMTGRDNSAPLVPQDNVGGDAATVVGGEVVEPGQPTGRKRK